MLTLTVLMIRRRLDTFPLYDSLARREKTDGSSAAATGAARDPEIPPSPAWNLPQRAAFRFVFLYLALYMIVAAPLGLILSIEKRFGTAPGGVAIQHAIETVWTPVEAWTGRHLLGIDVKNPGANADLAAFLSLVILSAAAALLWSVLDRRAGRDAKLYRGLKLAVRYVLGFVLVLYGMDKVVPNAQFPFPSLETLVSPLGDLSVYRLYWASMGTSTMYAAFAGGMEIVAAGFLFFSRTALLGALLAASAMANVAALNLGFDIPVKVFSTHLFLMAIFVLGGDLARLANFLLLNRPALPVDNGEPWRGGWFRMARISLKTVFLLYVFASSVQACLGIRRTRLSRSPLYGIYAVEEFTARGISRPPLTSDAGRWKTVVFSSPERIWIKRMDDSIQSLPAKYDTDKSALSISGKSKSDPGGEMTCFRPDREHLTLQGSFQNQALMVKLTRIDESKFPLAKTRVSWFLARDQVGAPRMTRD
jgi:hypothetical protein